MAGGSSLLPFNWVNKWTASIACLEDDRDSSEGGNEYNFQANYGELP